MGNRWFWLGLEKLVYFILFPALLINALLRTRLDLAAALPLQAQADTALRLEPGQGQWPLAAHTRYLHDPSGQIDGSQAWQRFQAGQASPLPAGGAAFGVQPGAYWFHLALENADRSQPHWLLKACRRYWATECLSLAYWDTLAWTAYCRTRTLRIWYRKPRGHCPAPLNVPRFY